jgi:predicted kinase
MSRKVIVLKGLPASGKSTYARDLIDRNAGRYKRVNKDDLRAMLDNSYWSKGNEKFVLKMRDWTIVEALNDGKNVLVDDTNLHPKHEARIRELVKEYNQQNNSDVAVEVKFFTIELEEAIARDLKRLNSVGEKVIREMYYQFIATKQATSRKQNPDLPKAVIVDIDGTVADNVTRSPFDFARVLEDKPIARTIELVRLLARDNYQIVFVSGREDSCMEDTEKWLNLHQIPYTELLMRKSGDSRKDSIIKREIFTNYIESKYCVSFVIDDRKQVKRMWVDELGLFVFDVNQEDLEF